MEYDYIVIGAGSSGCVVAARLSEHQNLNILLLEAGGPDTNKDIHIPLNMLGLRKTELDWTYATSPQPNANERQVDMPRGKVYGGSGALNGMIYQRGNPDDYDSWAKLGNEGWEWQEVLPYFKKSENNSRGGDDFHGDDGPMYVVDLPDPNPLAVAFVEAAQQAGYALNPDFNDGDQEGFNLYQATLRNGRRETSATAYLRPALQRDNLTAIPYAMVQHLTFENNRCTGAVYIKDGEAQTVTASKEVIVCGGAINSPQLLMLSGIGDKDHLAKHEIDVVMDLPGVGQNLQDHLMCPVSYFSSQPVSLARTPTADEIEQFEQDGRGILTSILGQAGGFIKLDPDAPVPDLQFHFMPALGNIAGVNRHGFAMYPATTRTKSVGYLKLQSADPNDAPFINPNYLDDPADMKVLVEGVKIARKVLNSPAFDAYREEEYLPGADVITDDEIEEHVRQNVINIYHPCGTCKMGNDPMAVVNDRLQVHGIEGLRVADASIMPFIVNSNINAACVMIAEKCVDLILEQA